MIPTTSLNKPAMRVMTLVLSVLLANYCWGQSRFPHGDVGIFDITENGPALKEEYLAGVSASKENYYVRAVNDQYLAIFGQLLKAPGAQTSPKSVGRLKCSLGEGFTLIGSLPESKYRTTYFFRRKEQQWAMVTVFDVKRAGAKVSFPKYLMTDLIDGKSIVTVLAVPPSDKGRRAVWTSNWHTQGIFFELYVQTQVDAALMLEFDYPSYAEVVRSVNCAAVS